MARVLTYAEALAIAMAHPDTPADAGRAGATWRNRLSALHACGLAITDGPGTPADDLVAQAMARIDSRYPNIARRDRNQVEKAWRNTLTHLEAVGLGATTIDDKADDQ